MTLYLTSLNQWNGWQGSLCQEHSLKGKMMWFLYGSGSRACLGAAHFALELTSPVCSAKPQHEGLLAAWKKTTYSVGSACRSPFHTLWGCMSSTECVCVCVIMCLKHMQKCISGWASGITEQEKAEKVNAEVMNGTPGDPLAHLLHPGLFSKFSSPILIENVGQIKLSSKLSSPSTNTHISPPVGWLDKHSNFGMPVWARLKSLSDDFWSEHDSYSASLLKCSKITSVLQLNIEDYKPPLQS